MNRREALVTIAAAASASAQPSAPIARLAEIIIPRTDTPGAIDAGVPAYIERRMKANPRLAAQITEGLATFDFDNIDATTPFFKLFKGLVVDGYYTSKAGLAQELGWHGNTFLSEFKGCDHPEHQAPHLATDHRPLATSQGDA